MHKEIKDYFEKKLLQNPKRIMNENGKIIEYYETHGSVLEDNELFPNGFPYEKYGIDRP